MNSLQTFNLGLIQGLTEFLPVSSSGHLVLVQRLLGLTEPELLLDTVLHLGTLVAIMLFFRRDLAGMAADLAHGAFHGPGFRMALWVVVGSVPTALIGFGFRRPFEALFGSVGVVGWMLVLTGCILASTYVLRRDDQEAVSTAAGIWIALAVGTAQGLAILPGISRSGATIVCALWCGLGRQTAGKLSFLLSIPAVLGAVVLQLNPSALGHVGTVPLLTGFATAVVSGLAALKLLMGLLRKGRLYYFAPYCWGIGLLALALGWYP